VGQWALVVICLSLIGAGCGTSQHASPRTPRPSLGGSAAQALAARLISPDPHIRQQALIPQLANQVGSTPLLDLGTTLNIESATFKAKGPTTGTVQATSTGTEAGRWTLYLVQTQGVWRLVEADPASS
jgi:hypothetical protein